MLERHERARALVATAVVLLCGVVVASCTTNAAIGTTSTSTTTTTTLPRSFSVSGSDSAGSFGSVWRIGVQPLAPGVYQPNPALAGTPGALVSEVRIGYRQFGSGPDLVLIMGEHGTMTWWQPQLLSDLAGHFRVTIFDLPGVGYSSALPRPINISSYGNVVAGFIYAMGLITPTVLGWGLGGDVALALAESHPHFVDHLVLVDSSTGGKAASVPSLAVRSAFASPLSNVTALSALLFPTSEDSARASWLSQIATIEPDDIVASAIHTEAQVQSQLDSSDLLTTRLASLKMPTLVIAGALDRVVPPANAHTLAQMIKHAELVMLPDAGYGALFQDEPRVVSLVETFAAKP